MTILPAKISVLLRPVGTADLQGFIIPDADGIAIDATNFAELQQGNPNLTFEIIDTDYSGAGYLRVGEASETVSWPSISYPVRAETPGLTQIFMRVLSSVSGLFSFRLLINGEVASTEIITLSTVDDWEWIQTSFVLPDRTTTTLTIEIQENNSSLDAIYLCKNGSPPSELIFNSPYVTVHARIYLLDNNEFPTTAVPFYDIKTSLNDIKTDDWYNFHIIPLLGQSFGVISDSFSLILFVSGTNDQQYIVWDFDAEPLDPYVDKCSITWDNESREWKQDCDSKLAIRTYEFVDSLDLNGTKIITPGASISDRAFVDFDDPSTQPIFLNTNVVSENGTEKVALHLPNRIVPILMDMSGSATWNDSGGLRYDLTRRMINRVDATYPGEVKWNVFSFQGTPIRLNFFAVVESDNINTNNVNAVAQSYFADQESGFAGVRVVRKEGSFPLNAIDGEIVQEGFFDRAFDDNLTEATDYFYKVFTFDKNGTFSDGIEIQAAPRERVIPHGIGQFTANVLKGSGIKLDDSVIAAWHMNEGSGSILYDFTKNQVHASFNGTDPIWLNSNDVPSGASGVRLNGVNEYFLAKNSNAAVQSLIDITIMGWIQPFTLGVLPVVEKGDESMAEWTFGISGGNLFFRTTSSATDTSSPLSIGQWNHIAATFRSTTGEVFLYVNGVESGPYSIPVPSTFEPEITIGTSRTLNASFFGKITELTIHNAIRNQEYIMTASQPPSQTRDKILDNADRLIVLNYSVPQDYDFVGGKIRIVSKESAGVADYSFTGDVSADGQLIRVFNGYGLPPFHENDGDVILDSIAAPGAYSLTIQTDFVHDRVYNYKIFSQNIIGNYSNWADSPVLSIAIPSMDQKDRDKAIGPPVPSLSSIPNVITQVGNRKVYHRWLITGNDQRVAEVRVYYSDTSFPVFDGQDSTTNAELIFRGRPDETFFVHRNINNDEQAFYAILTLDKYGYRSDPSYYSAVPIASADETGIPLLEVKKLRYEVVDEVSLSIAWEQPIKFQKEVSAWFDQRVALYAQITDEFGAPLADDSNIQFITVASTTSSQNAENVFGESVDRTLTEPTPEETFVLSSTASGGGLIKGLIRLVEDFNIISAINELVLQVMVFFAIPDRENVGENIFEYRSQPIVIKMHNPFKMELVNQSGDNIKHLCKQEVPLSDPEFISTGGLLFEPNLEQDFDGTYIRRTRPFIARVKISYRDKPVNSGGRVFVSVQDASDPQCNNPNSDSKFVPIFFDSKSKSVLPPATTLNLQNSTETDSQSGVIQNISYVDIPLRPAIIPLGVMLFAQASYNGYICRKKMYIVFENILRIELTVNEPAPDCIDQAEQFANVYLIDPDSPNPRFPNKSKLPDLQICKWNLQKGISGKDRPFFSLDTVPTGPGVFSYVRNSIARKVFFGPACGVTWTIVDLGPENGGPAQLPEMYAIKASVVYDGLSTFEERPVVIYPNITPGTFGSRFLMQLRDMLVEMWADGYAYEHMTIHRDPNSAGGIFGGNFRACSEELGGPLFVLDYGQPIRIESGDEFEIIYGERLSISLDPYIDEFEFQNAQKDIGFASVPLSTISDITDVYFRINKFIGPPAQKTGNQTDDSDKPITNICSAIEVPTGLREEPDDRIISGSTSVIFNGDERFLVGGGDLKNGIPPCVIRLKEPLKVRIVDVRVNGASTDHLIIDGETEHTFIIEVIFAGKTVPDGTPLFLSIGGQNPTKIQLYQQTIFTTQREDSILLVGIKSYAQFTILPLNPIESFSAQIQAECKFDKRGDATRSITACVTLTYDSSETRTTSAPPPPIHGQIDNVFSSDLLVYDSFLDEWKKKSDMIHARGALSLTWSFDAYGEHLYAIGGLNGQSINSYNEQYSINSDIWTDVSPMPTPRFHHLAIQDAGYIYVFGGITAENASLVITATVERYDPSTDSWKTMTPMPTINNTSYGVGLGSIAKIDNLVYVLGGVIAINSQGSVLSMNDRVLVYDLNNDSWSYSDVFSGTDITLYERIAPFAFADQDSGLIHVCGGAIISGTGSTQTLEFATDALVIDPLHFILSQDDSSYTNIPIPRYKGANTSIGDAHYFLGGTNKKSQVLRTFEQIDVSTSPFGFLEPTQPDTAKQSLGFTTDENSLLFAAGGITSGRPNGFIQIKAVANPDRIRLDGKQSSGIDIELIDDSGMHPTKDVRVLIRGFLVFPTTPGASVPTEGSGGSDQGQQQSSGGVDRQSLIYPVVLSSNDFVISNGFGTTTLLPRSDDVLRKIDEIKRKLNINSALVGEGLQTKKLVIEEGVVRNPYSIRIQVTVVDDFYYGQSVVNIHDNQDPDQITTINETSGTSGTTGSNGGTTSSGITNTTQPAILFERCISISASQHLPPPDNGGGLNTGSGQTIQPGLDSSSIIFQLNPVQIPQLQSPSITYFCDIEWLPQVISHLADNTGTADQAIKVIKRLKNSIPFGGSPFYDGLKTVAQSLLEDSANGFLKTIYVHTDNEENLSLSSIDDAIEEIQSINGFGKVPVVLNNFSVVFPTTLSALVDRTDTDSLERIAKETGGQSQTVLDATFVDDILNNSLGRLEGSIGWGYYEVIVDLGVSSLIRSISLDFELFENTDGNWRVSASEDGFIFGDDSEQYDPEDEIDFSSLVGRYLKFKVSLLSGLSASIVEAYESEPTPGVPALLSININFSLPEESIIFLNGEENDHSPQQIAVAIRANRPKGSRIDVGISTSNSNNWADYTTGSQPAADQYGKIYIPIRTQQDDANLNEPLISIDGFVWKAKYGSWNPESGVTIKDSNGGVIDSNHYRVFSRKGLIVFDSKQSGILIIDIENSGKLRVAIRMQNTVATEPIEIEGIGYFYNTNVFLLPPLTQRPPEASSLLCIPNDPTIFSKISATYRYFDLNRDQESGTEIRWYINGIELEYLRGLTEWNNINNFDDPIWVYGFSFTPQDVPTGISIEEYARQQGQSLLRVDDLIYFTVRPNDGNSFGTIVRSPSAKVVAAPPFITRLEIKGRTISGTTQSNITTATTTFADYNFFDDGGENISTIIWFVNGTEFKRGSLSGTTGGFSNNELVPGELRAGTGTVAIVIGNSLEVEIRPATGSTIGNPIRSSAKTVENSPPIATDVIVAPANPTSNSNLQVSYTFNDVDVRAGSVTQTDQSSIRWFRKRGAADFEEVTSIANQQIAPNTQTAAGDQWYAQIIPFDGISVGDAVQSNTVTIR